MSTAELLQQFHEIAANPTAQKDAYLAAGKKIALVTYYTPEELIHSMGIVPFTAYGADVQVNEAKQYFPAFICSIMQTILELGMNGTYKGCSAIVIPSLCDSLKCLGENWKYAVKDIKFIPMTYPQNRKPAYGKEFTKAGYERVIKELEETCGVTYDDAKAADSIKIYNEHNALMREFSELCAAHPEITAAQRSDVFKSAGFMLKEEHTALVKELISSIQADEVGAAKKRIYISGILADAPGLNEIFDDMKLQIVGDDIFAFSRQYRTDGKCMKCADLPSNLDAMAEKFCAMDDCSLLYDVKKHRVEMIVEEAQRLKADGIVLVLTKFCDPEEFDNPLVKKAADAAGIPCIVVEVDRQMQNYEQARTMLETFADIL